MWKTSAHSQTSMSQPSGREIDVPLTCWPFSFVGQPFVWLFQVRFWTFLRVFMKAPDLQVTPVEDAFYLLCQTVILKTPLHDLWWKSLEVMHIQWRVEQELCQVLIIFSFGFFRSDLSFACIEMSSVYSRMRLSGQMWCSLIRNQSMRWEVTVFLY